MITITYIEYNALKAGAARLLEGFNDVAVDLAIVRQQAPEALAVLLKVYPKWNGPLTSLDLDSVAFGIITGKYSGITLEQ